MFYDTKILLKDFIEEHPLQTITLAEGFLDAPAIVAEGYKIDFNKEIYFTYELKNKLFLFDYFEPDKEYDYPSPDAPLLITPSVLKYMIDYNAGYMLRYLTGYLRKNSFSKWKVGKYADIEVIFSNDLDILLTGKLSGSFLFNEIWSLVDCGDLDVGKLLREGKLKRLANVEKFVDVKFKALNCQEGFVICLPGEESLVTNILDMISIIHIDKNSDIEDIRLHKKYIKKKRKE